MYQRLTSAFTHSLTPSLVPLTSTLTLILALSSAFMCYTARRASAEVVDRIVAIVGDEVVTLTEVLEKTFTKEEELRRTANPLEYGRVIRELREMTLERLINESLILQLAEEQGLEVTDAEVEKTLPKLLARQGLTVDSYVRQGGSLEVARREVRKQILQQRIMQIQLEGKTSVTELEIRDKYRELVSRMRGQKRVKGSHLLLTVPPGSTAAQEAAVKQRARELRERAVRGEDFPTLVRTFGQGPSAPSGGDLGLISRGGGIPRELEEAFLALDADQFSEPVRSAYGYHILWVREVLIASPPSFAQAKEQLRQMIAGQKYQRAFDEWILELKNQVFIERRL